MEKQNSEIIKEQIQKTIIITTILVIFSGFIFTTCSSKSTNKQVNSGYSDVNKKVDSLMGILNENQILIDHKIEKLNIAFLNLIEFQANSRQKEELMKLLKAKDAQIKALKHK